MYTPKDHIPDHDLIPDWDWDETSSDEDDYRQAQEDLAMDER